MQDDELMGIIARITLFSVQGVSETDTPFRLFASRLFLRPRTAGDDQKSGHDGLEPPSDAAPSTGAAYLFVDRVFELMPRVSPGFHRHGLFHPGRSAVSQLSKAPSVVGR